MRLKIFFSLPCSASSGLLKSTAVDQPSHNEEPCLRIVPEARPESVPVSIEVTPLTIVMVSRQNLGSLYSQYKEKMYTFLKML